MSDGGRAWRRWLLWAGVLGLAAAGVLWALDGEDTAGPMELSERTDLIAMVCGVLGGVAVLATLWRRPEEAEAEAVARLAREVKVLGEPQWSSSLGGDLTAIDVTFAFRPYANARAAELPASPQGRLEKVVEDYRELRPRRMVITGEPGAGKTVLARKFVMELCRVREDREPVPVLVALADWDPGEPLLDWLAGHLERDYGMPPASARRVVAARMVLPVLDGLDEMDPDGTAGADSRAGRALAALARHQDGIAPGPLVLTCRTREYDLMEADGEHILDAARIEIAPVTPAQARDFLAVRGAARRPALWQPVLDELRDRPAGVLARALSTPWRLTLAAVAYDRAADPGELLAAAGERQLADLLLSRFIPASVANTPVGRGRYPVRQVHRRLHELARLLGAGSRAGTDLPLLALGLLVPQRLLSLIPYLVLMPAAVVAVVPVVRAMVNGSPLVPIERDRLVGQTAAYGLLLLLLSFRGLGPSARLALPRLGSHLWMVGLRRARPKLLGFPWGPLLLGQLAIAVWLGLPEADGGRGDLAAAAVALLVWTAVLVVLSATELDSTAVGTGGQFRAQAFWALVLTGAAGLLAMEVVGGSVVSVFPVGLLLGLAAAMATRLVGYYLFLLGRLGRLPLRLARFLDWSVSAGLLRTSGAAYQFRHREFQEWLVRNPTP
ncbi:NACHT domain-containing protein [Streptomyces sp. NPDC056144]|uniref:NACHT domain-containing protein n=1 Tax=unclassified Streptomyces TaxID=2593676 RepID=UPI0035D99331